LVGIDDVIKAIEIAKLRGWYDHNYFDVKEYNRLASLFDGDMNWIIPGKILATSSPSVCEAEG
jgi:cell division cycle 14